MFFRRSLETASMHFLLFCLFENIDELRNIFPSERAFLVIQNSYSTVQNLNLFSLVS